MTVNVQMYAYFIRRPKLIVFHILLVKCSYRLGRAGGGPVGGLLGKAGGPTAGRLVGGRGGGALLLGAGGNSLLGVEAAEVFGVPPVLLSLASETGVEACRGGKVGLEEVTGGKGGGGPIVSPFSSVFCCTFSCVFRL